MTIGAAIAFTVAFFAAKRRGAPTGALFTTMLMFWGAALMWAVDCVANAMDGEGLIDLSREDTVLGAIIVAAGVVVFAVLFVVERCRCRRAQKLTT
jgi:uncharacterized membrane protein